MYSQKLKITITVMAIAAIAPAQFRIENSAEAQANATQTDSQLFTRVNQWDNASRRSEVNANAPIHPFDPPSNIATASSHFRQPQYGDATIRSKSLVLSDYSGSGSLSGYRAVTAFHLTQEVYVHISGGLLRGAMNLELITPMHGLMAAQGNTFGGTATAFASSTVSARRRGEATLVDETSGSLTVASPGSWTATGDWLGDVQEEDVPLDTGIGVRETRGVELDSADLLDLGEVESGGDYYFDIDYDFVTSALISTSSGFATSDFSGTGAYKFRVLDEFGVEVTDFTVTAVGGVAAVPEPVTLLTLGLGLVLLRRRSRR